MRKEKFFYQMVLGQLDFHMQKDEFIPPFVEPKFVCLRHSKVKQTKMLEFGAEKVLLRGPSKEKGWLVLKRPELLDGSQGRAFKGKICG